MQPGNLFPTAESRHEHVDGVPGCVLGAYQASSRPIRLNLRSRRGMTSSPFLQQNRRKTEWTGDGRHVDDWGCRILGGAGDWRIWR